MADNTVLSYLAGAMDSDGSFGIKRSTYHMRVRKDANNPVFSERVMLKQVTPEIPRLLQETFGGTVRMEKARTENGKPLYSYECKDRQAAAACALLLPFLLVKRKQAETLLELRETKGGKYKQAAYWFVREFPNWRDMELITSSETAALLGYTNGGSVSQAIRNGSLVATGERSGWSEVPRIPRLLVERIVDAGGPRCSPPELIAWQESLCERVRELNKIGINGTEIYRRDGHHTPA